jgi:hypothetical protein
LPRQRCALLLCIKPGETPASPLNDPGIPLLGVGNRAPSRTRGRSRVRTTVARQNFSSGCWESRPASERIVIAVTARANTRRPATGIREPLWGRGPVQDDSRDSARPARNFSAEYGAVGNPPTATSGSSDLNVAAHETSAENSFRRGGLPGRLNPAAEAPKPRRSPGVPSAGLPLSPLVGFSRPAICVWALCPDGLEPSNILAARQFSARPAFLNPESDPHGTRGDHRVKAAKAQFISILLSGVQRIQRSRDDRGSSFCAQSAGRCGITPSLPWTTANRASLARKRRAAEFSGQMDIAVKPQGSEFRDGPRTTVFTAVTLCPFPASISAHNRRVGRSRWATPWLPRLTSPCSRLAGSSSPQGCLCAVLSQHGSWVFHPERPAWVSRLAARGAFD